MTAEGEKTLAQVMAENPHLRSRKIFYTAEDIGRIRATMRYTLAVYDHTGKRPKEPYAAAQRAMFDLLMRYAVPNVDALRAWLNKPHPSDQHHIKTIPGPPGALPRSGNGGIIPRSRTRTRKT